MKEMSASVWKNQGSSVIFNRHQLGSFITANCMISLRQSLLWLNHWPDEPSGNGKSVLVAGLETYMESLDKDDAEYLLRHRVKPFILEFQSRWDQCGLIFGFSQAEKFKVSANEEEVLFVRRDRKEVRFSRYLWDGNSTLDVRSVVDNYTQPTAKPVTIGYHVRRIS